MSLFERLLLITLNTRTKTIFKYQKTTGVIEAPSTRIRTFFNPQLFLCEFGLRLHISDESGIRIRNFLDPLSRVEIFWVRYESGIVLTLNPDILLRATKGARQLFLVSGTLLTV